MESSRIIAIVVVVAIIMLVIWFLLFRSSRRVNLTGTAEGEKPKWMRSSPPPETLAATQADGEGVSLYDHDEGEILASPFAEQIEDILRAQMSTDAYLRSLEIDFGTAPDGSLEIRAGQERYTEIAKIPDVRLREAILRAIETYKQRSQ